MHTLSFAVSLSVMVGLALQCTGGAGSAPAQLESARSSLEPGSISERTPAVESDRYERRDLWFPCGEVRCAAWVYTPRGTTRPPVVVMANGFGATRALFLRRYAEHFVTLGLASLVFDYRSFGDSEGEPRQVISVDAQLDDWAAAVRAARSLEELDGTRLALWGTSFAGGHVLVTGARTPEVRAIVAQTPFVDGDAGESAPFGYQLRAAASIARDLGRRLIGRPPYYIPVLAPPGTFSALTTPEAYRAFEKTEPDDPEWVNAIAARSLLEVGPYRPVESASSLRCPLLLVAERQDQIVPLSSVAEAASLAPRARLVVLEGTHFDIYAGPGLRQALRVEGAFLQEMLLADDRASQADRSSD